MGILPYADATTNETLSVLSDDGYTTCDLTLTYSNYAGYGISVVYIILFSLLEKRKKRSDCLGGRPGIISPVNLLDHHDDPVSLAAAFGSLAGACLNLAVHYSQDIHVPSWASVLFLLMTALSFGLVFYPLFAALSTEWFVLGSIFGFCLSALRFTVYLLQIVCPHGDPGDSEVVEKISEITIYTTTPVVLCFLFLSVKFMIRIIAGIIVKIRSRSHHRLREQADLQHLATRRNRMHVRLLLSSAKGKREMDSVTMETERWTTRARRLFHKWIYLPDPTFEYSPRIVAVFTVAILCTYQIGILIVLVTKDIHNSIVVHIDNADITNELFIAIIYAVIDSSVVSFVLASLLITWSIFQILTSYRRDIRRMYKGDFSGLPFTRHNWLSQLILTHSLTYAGAQVGYTLMGYLVTFIVLWITCVIISCLIILPLTGKLPMAIFTSVFGNILSGFVIEIGFYLVLMCCVRFMLQSRSIQRHNTRWRSVRVLAIDNRKVYQNVQYFLFFCNIVLGVFEGLTRIVESIVLGVIYLPRLDRCSLMRGFEKCDMGYMHYVSMLHVETCHRHPVMLVCCDLLLSVTHQKRGAQRDTSLRKYGAIDSESHADGDVNRHTETSTMISAESRLARNRWLKAYTLLRNPLVARVNDFSTDCDLMTSLSTLQNEGTGNVDQSL